MSDAAENLARAEVNMERGFTDVAIAYALMSLAHSRLDDDQQNVFYDEVERLRKRGWSGSDSAT